MIPIRAYGAEPANGLSLIAALRHYADDPPAVTRFDELLGFMQIMRGDGQPFLPERDRLEYFSLQQRLLEDLISKLRAGTLIARGSRPGDLQLLPVPAHWWGAVQVELFKGEAEINGVHLCGIVVFDARRSDERQNRATLRTKPDQAEVDHWMVEHVTVATKRAAALKDCMNDIGATDRQARTGWNKLPDEMRGKKGQRK